MDVRPFTPVLWNGNIGFYINCCLETQQNTAISVSWHQSSGDAGFLAFCPCDFVVSVFEESGYYFWIVYISPAAFYKYLSL